MTTQLRGGVRHELLVKEMKERGNRCMKKQDYVGAVAAYSTALGKGTWVELGWIEGRLREDWRSFRVDLGWIVG